MKYIHAVLPNGEVVKGVEVFRRIYEVIGLGWVYAATKIPLIGSAAGTFSPFVCHVLCVFTSLYIYQACVCVISNPHLPPPFPLFNRLGVRSMGHPPSPDHGEARPGGDTS